MSDAAPDPSREPPTELISLKEVEKRHIVRVLAALDGNRARAARILGIDRRSLYRRLYEYGIQAPRNPR